MSDDTRLGYQPALDGLRAVAVLAVLAHHTGVLLLGDPRVARGGFLGVDVFFVLSGFLITTLIVERREEPRPLRSFYLRRALRLLPAFAAMLAAVTALAVLQGRELTVVANTLGFSLTYAFNWAIAGGYAVDDHATHLWSLAIEEQFYLLWPLIVLAAVSAGVTPRRLIALALTGCVLVACRRAQLWHSGVGWIPIYPRTDAHADGLLLGCALALAPWRRLRLQRGFVAAGLLGLVAAFLLIPRDSAFLYLGGFTLVALVVAVTVAATLDERGLLAGRPLVAIGQMSYGLYLWHFPVFVLAGERLAAWPAAARTAVAWLCAVLCAAASLRWIERPMLRRKALIGRRSRSNLL